MAFKLEVIYWGGTLDVSAGTTYGLEDMNGLGAASVRRLAERGPQQDGDTDLGYRADPGVLTLPHLLLGTSDSHLDTLRDTLQKVYLPTSDPLNVRVTRDDGSVRQIDVHRTGPLDVPLVRLQRPGHIGRAVVQLKASNPVWYDPTPGYGTVLLATDWWLAYGAIGSANVLEHVESPGTAQTWTYAGTVNDGTPWAVVFRGGSVNLNGDYAWGVGAIGSPGETSWHYNSNRYEVTVVDNFVVVGTSIMQAGTHNYFMIADGTADITVYRDNVAIGAGAGFGITGLGDGIGTAARRWRSNSAGDAASTWSAAIPRAAVYNIAPNAAQRANLHAAMEASGTAFSLDLAYGGQWPEYPVIRITGPISDPAFTNASTGETLSFSGYSIGSADYYDIDLRYGYKTVTNSGGDNKIGELSSDSDRASFHIAPPSEVSGGTNTFQLTGTATGTATSAVLTYYNRFPSY